MGHTRMTTQGDELHNYNNHPFLGAAEASFALAHNGIIHNDSSLRTEKSLPRTKIETDSYVAVQLLAQQGNVSFQNIRAAVEPLRGALTLTILDSRDDLYIAKGNNPLFLYHFPRAGLYVYASTEAILRKGLKQDLPTKERPFDVLLQEGNILRIDTSGRYTTEVFDTRNLWNGRPYFLWPCADVSLDGEYIRDLKSVAPAYGYTPHDIDVFLSYGLCPEEIEELLMEQLGVDEVYIDRMSGKNTNRPQLQKMMAYVRRGDTVIVESISRFARNTRDLLELVEQLAAKGVEFVSKKEAIDTTIPTGKFMLTVFGAVAELEREYILQRQREGIREYLDVLGLDEYDPWEIVKRTQGRMAEDEQWIEVAE